MALYESLVFSSRILQTPSIHLSYLNPVTESVYTVIILTSYDINYRLH